VDKKTLIPIGRFAKLTDLSPRLLRRLGERGLLSPELVDPDTRYRYYSLGQTRVAGLIHLGRQMGLTVDQLSDLIAASEAGDLHSHLERHREAVAAKLAEQSRLLRVLDRELERGDGLMQYDVAIKDVPAVLVMSAAGSVRRTHPHDPWALEFALRRVGARAAVQIARQGEEPDVHGIILYHSDLAWDDEMSFEVCIPLAHPLPGCPEAECKELPAARVAFITFRGPYDTIWNAHVELLAWVAEHEYRTAGAVREVGIVIDADTDDPREWVTELAVPIDG
jgi:DNA-binding transcriptional MerR regulator/effector-binding domain-containing protein